LFDVSGCGSGIRPPPGRSANELIVPAAETVAIVPIAAGIREAADIEPNDIGCRQSTRSAISRPPAAAM